MTNQQGAPEALRLADALDLYATGDEHQRDIEDAAAELRRLHYENERLAALVEAQQPTTHVPNPAEIEHVAGDVSKTGAEANTSAQQPAPEYVGNGMFKGETIEKAAEHWANWCDVRCMTGLSEFLRVVAARAPADSVTAPAGGADWQDISTAPKDGTRFVATGHNYGLYSEVRHVCIAQWLAGCWVEVSDWNGASKLKYLTHWMPLPPLPCSAARTPADSVEAEVRKDDEALIRQMRNALYALPLPYTSETRAALQAGNEWLDAAIAERARLEKAP